MSRNFRFAAWIFLMVLFGFASIMALVDQSFVAAMVLAIASVMETAAATLNRCESPQETSHD